MPVLMRTGTSGTSMITCINPKAEDYDETLSILANSSMAHEIREIPKIGRMAGNGGGATSASANSTNLPAPLLHQNSSRSSSVLTGDRQRVRSSNLRDASAAIAAAAASASASASVAPPNSSKKRDASCLSRKFSQESIDTLLSSSSALGNGNGNGKGTGKGKTKGSHGSHEESLSGDGSHGYELQISLLNDKIAELEHENSLIQMEQLEKERLIREEVCEEMAERSGSLLEQIRSLQNELYSLKTNGYAYAHGLPSGHGHGSGHGSGHGHGHGGHSCGVLEPPQSAVKKAKRKHEIATHELVTTELRETEEEMEVMKSSYEKEIKLLRNEIRSLKAEVSDWRKKAEGAMKIISLTKTSASSHGSEGIGTPSSLSSGLSSGNGNGMAMAVVNNENEEWGGGNSSHVIISTSAAETFDERMQRDQRFNKHKKLAELSPKMILSSPAAGAGAGAGAGAAGVVREPLSSVSPNSSPVDLTSAPDQHKSFPSKHFNNATTAALNLRSPPPSPHRSSDALPIAPPQSDIKLNSAPFVPNRVLRSQLRMA
jgi:hypothetical protein